MMFKFLWSLKNTRGLILEQKKTQKNRTLGKQALFSWFEIQYRVLIKIYHQEQKSKASHLSSHLHPVLKSRAQSTGRFVPSSSMKICESHCFSVLIHCPCSSASSPGFQEFWGQRGTSVQAHAGEASAAAAAVDGRDRKAWPRMIQRCGVSCSKKRIGSAEGWSSSRQRWEEI